MKIDKFTEVLLPNMVKEDLLEDCRVNQAILKEVLTPAYKSALEYFGKRDFSNEMCSELNKSFRQSTKASGKNFVVAIADTIPDVITNLNATMDMVHSMFGNNVAGQGLTYLQANTIQFLEYVGFYARYARRLLSYVTIYETSMIEGSGITPESVKDSIPPAEEAWIQENFANFTRIYTIVTTDHSKLTKLFKDIPDVVVTKNNYDTLKSTLGENRLDPMAMKFVTGLMNPFYFVGRLFAEWQVNRYNTAKKDKELFELRIMNLELIAKGQPNAKVQKEIEYLEGQVQKLEAKIAEMEKNYGA